MSKIVAGTQTAIEQPSNYGWQNGRGFYTKRRWKVTAAADVDALVAELAALGYSYDVSEIADGAAWEVAGSLDTDPNAPTPETNTLSEVWERDTQVSDRTSWKATC